MAEGYFRINTGEGIKFGHQSLELATKIGWDKGMAEACNCIGSNYYIKANYPKALEYYFKALKLKEKSGNKRGVAAVTCNMGNIYLSQSDYPNALASFFKALKLYEELGDKQGIAVSTGNIGNVYGAVNDYSKALEYYFKALRSYEELGNKAGVQRNNGNIGIIYSLQNDNTKALEYYFKALRLSEELEDKGNVARNAGNIGNVYQKQGDYILAIAYMQRAQKLNEELGDKLNAAGNLSNIGSVYISIVKKPVNSVTLGTSELSASKYHSQVLIPHGKESLLAAAIDCQLRTLTIFRELNVVDALKYPYEVLSEAYKLKGDYKMALNYADSLRVTNDSIFSHKNRDKILEQESKRKEYGDSLKAVAARNAADVKMAHRSNYELIGGGVLVLALGVIFLLRKNNKLLDKEKKQSDNLLLNILPEEVAAQLKDTGKSAAKQFDNVTVLFTDFVDFTEASERMTPEMLIEELDTCFKIFDDITARHNIEKIKTIGDAYLAVCGLPSPDPKHAENIVTAAVEISAFMQDRLAKIGSERTFAVRIGIHTGSVVAGIVGTRKFAYDIWGDTVNTAARMEQNSEAGKINISETTYELVKDKYPCEYRGEIDAKGKGKLKMYFVG